ncbi:transcriptional regulator BetI [Pseudovibrio axinellae]|uniref:Transcriptional regulator BetI n=1 Tax=Pseudovibrio axinellae TaxID=989403 RepID=A0A165YY98_9HYPH|nr:TetR/AcrR family transcriptional regulator [Pseudovibrio axinellae]KZL19343.1 transcriptional regulator BetI [Pseudovibrio axinellae]SEQ40488.1 transcriptional regulator, TetR family [Pseudovibrio axinellae]
MVEVEKKVSRGEKRKYELLEIATDAIIELGYANTSMDEIVRRARASKTTVYRYFKNKEAMLAEIVSNLSEGPVLSIRSLDSHADGGSREELKETLFVFGKTVLKLVYDEKTLGLWRVLIGEGRRTQHITKSFFQLGPKRATTSIAQQLQLANDLGILSIDTPENAAAIFMGMLREDTHLALLLGVRSAPNEQQIRDHVKDCVCRFMRAYAA